MRYFIGVVAISLLFINNLNAGGLSTESDSTRNIDMDFSVVSQHLWRGTAQGQAPAVRPDIRVDFLDGFSISGGAVYSVDRSYDEMDLSMSYQFNDFEISFSDYYAPAAKGYEAENLFNYDEQTTDHFLDLALDYKPFNQIPFNFTMATGLWGNRFNEYKENRYSTYFETNYQVKQADYHLDFFVGVTPGEGLYNEKFSVVNMGMTFHKMFEYSQNRSFPVSASIVGNPAHKQLHVSFALAFI